MFSKFVCTWFDDDEDDGSGEGDGDGGDEDDYNVAIAVVVELGHCVQCMQCALFATVYATHTWKYSLRIRKL